MVQGDEYSAGQVTMLMNFFPSLKEPLLKEKAQCVWPSCLYNLFCKKWENSFSIKSSKS